MLVPAYPLNAHHTLCADHLTFRGGEGGGGGVYVFLEVRFFPKRNKTKSRLFLQNFSLKTAGSHNLCTAGSHNLCA